MDGNRRNGGNNGNNNGGNNGAGRCGDFLMSGVRKRRIVGTKIAARWIHSIKYYLLKYLK